MNKLRCILATIALIVTLLSGLSLQGMGSMANAAFSQHASSTSASFVAGKVTGPVALKRAGPCPGGVTLDC